MSKHEDHNRPPEIEALLAALEQSRVRYVLTGSVAAMAYGVEVQPGDLDITPALDHENLARLGKLLQAIDAMPAGSPGHWEAQPSGEQTWIAGDLPADERSAWQAAWTPDSHNVATYDHLFATRFGRLDVVPAIAGSYAQLAPRALWIDLLGYVVAVAHVDDLLATLTIPRRAKDAARVRQLRTMQREHTVAARHNAMTRADCRES